MNILILANKPPYPPKDGSSLATLSITDGLAKLGNSVTVLAISTQKHPCTLDQIPSELKSIINFHLISINTEIKFKSAVKNLLRSKLPYNVERFISNSFKEKLKELLTTQHFDLIQLEGHCLIPYIETIRGITNSPITYRSHNIEHEIWQRIAQHEANPLKSWYFRLLSRRTSAMEENIARSVDSLVAISKRDELWFLANNFDKPSITIPSGLTYSRLEVESVLNDNLCYLGSLDWIPNQEGLIWFLELIWPKILQSKPSLELHIAGRNAPKTFVERITKRKNVIYHGEIENAQEYLNNFSILVVPLLSGSGMRVKIIEGMVLAKAIVTTTIGVEGIEAKNREQILIEDSPESFANAVLELVQNKSLRKSLMINAYNFAIQQYDNKRFTEELMSFYRKLVNGC